MTYKTLLKKLQKLSPEELKQEVRLFYGDGGSYSMLIGMGKTEEENETLGCEEDGPSRWKKGQVYLIHSC